MPKVFEGVVVSTKLADTAIVEVTRRVPHPLYRKLLTRSKKYKVDVKGKEVSVGQKVKITETRKLAKDKYFTLLEENK
jgi:small subunit ribosomal protein S17